MDLFQATWSIQNWTIKLEWLAILWVSLSAWTTNMWNEATYITSMAIFEKRDYTEDENERLVEILSAKKWIDEQRKLCSQEISNL